MPRPRETLAQAAARMKREGFSQKQIQGQISRWHPDWAPQRINAVIPTPPKGGARQPAQDRPTKEAIAFSGKSQLTSFDLPTKPPPTKKTNIFSNKLTQLPGWPADVVGTPLEAALTPVIGPAQAPLQPRLIPTMAPPTPKETLDQQVKLTHQMLVPGKATKARTELAKTLTPGEKLGLIQRDIEARKEAPILRPQKEGSIFLAPGELAKHAGGIAHALPGAIETLELLPSKALEYGVRQALKRPASGEGTTVDVMQPPRPQPLGAPLKGPTYVAGGIGRLATALAVAPAGIVAHPLRAVRHGTAVIRGASDLAVMTGNLLNPSISTAAKHRIAHEAGGGFLDYIVKNYGPNATWRDAVSHGFNEPVETYMDFASVAAPYAEAVTVLRLMRGGLTFGEARAVARDPARIGDFPHANLPPHTPRVVTVRQRHGEDIQVPLHQARSPYGRAIDKAVDVVTGGVETAAGRRVGPRIPFTPTRRGQRELVAQARREQHKLTAEAHALWRDVTAYTGKDTTEGARLFFAHQKPGDIPDEVWFNALAAHTKQLLEEGPASGRRVTATEQKLQKRLDRFTAQAKTQANNRWKTLIEDVHTEKLGLHGSLNNIENALRSQRLRLRVAESGDTSGIEQGIADLLEERKTATPERAREIDAQVARLKHEGDYPPTPEAVRADIRTLENQRDALKAQLDDLTVQEDPISAPGRDRFQAALEDSPKLDEEQRGRLLQMEDTIARMWGKRHDRDPAEYYDSPDFIADFQRLEHLVELPEGAFAQVRESAIAANANRLDPEGRFARSDSGRVVYNEDHRGLVEKLEQAEAADAEVKKRLPGKANQKHPERKAAADALAAAREDELFARIRYNSQTYGEGRGTTNAGRHTLAQRLVKTYKGRVNALPRGVETSGELERIMSLLDELTTRGEGARFWYENSAKAIKKLANGDKELAAKIAQLVAIYSPQKAVIPNLGEAIKAYNSWHAGQTIENGLKWQKDTAKAVLDGTGNWDGRKTNNFYMNFLEDIDKRKYNSERKLTAEDKKRLKKEGIDIGRDQLGEVTADMWMARVFGYLTKNVSAGRYDVIEEITRQLAKERGWKPKQVQAAIWTAVKDISDDVSANVDFADAIAHHHGVVNYHPVPSAVLDGPWGETFRALAPEAQQVYMTRFNNLVGDFMAETGVLSRGVEAGPTIARGETVTGGRAKLVSGFSPLDAAVSEPERNMYRFVSAAIGRAGQTDSVSWVRGFVAGSKGKEDMLALKLNRAATAEEAQRLHDLLNPPGQPERVLIEHAGNEGLVLRRNPALSQEEYPNFAVAKAKKPDTFHGQVADAIGEVFPKLPEGRATMSGHDGERLTNDWTRGAADYEAALQAALGDAGGSERVLRLRESADRLARDAEELRTEVSRDPAGAAERHPGELAAARKDAGVVSDGAPRGPPEVEQPPTTLAQSRNNDILGAVHFLTDTPEGGRILYYSQNADISTWLHELYGHAARELKAAHPDEFRAVEDMIGKPLEEWGVAEHEKFARMAEAYFMSGKAPTPELVDTFKSLKRWMRTIYGAEQRLGVNLHPTVRDLFDTHFGSYEDQNVYRVASRMTSPTQEYKSTVAHGLQEFTDKELAALRRRNDVRAYRRSTQGLYDSMQEQSKAINEAGGWDNATLAQREKLEATTTAWLKVKGAEEVAKIDRETGLRTRLSLLEDILAKPAGPGYESALAGLAKLADDREQILRDAFGDDFMDKRADRVDLLADMLANEGLLPEDFARGTAHYAEHAEYGYDKLGRLIARPAQALLGGTVGKVDTRMLNLYSRNHLIRWMNGDLSADPKVILDAWQNAQAYAFATRWKNVLGDAGKWLEPDQVIPDDAIFINLEGTPSSGFRKQKTSMNATDEAQQAMDAIAGRDTAAIEKSIESYLNNVFIEGKDLKQMIAESDHPAAMRAALRVKVIDRRFMEALTRPLRGANRTGGKLLDMTNTIARFSLIYTNPAYIPVNLFGNLLFLTGTQGPRGLANLVSAGRLMLTNKKLADRIAAGTGELPATAAISRGRGGSDLTRWLRSHVEDKYLHALTYIPDRWPRIAAWISEAQKAGYHTDAEMLELIEGKTTRAKRDYDKVSARSTQSMVDFEKASDAEKQTIGRILFIWPWIRGATAWPFYYAREFPFATSVAAGLGNQMDEYRRKVMGNVPVQYRDFVPLGVPGKALEKGFNAAPFGPGSTAAQSIDTILGLIEGATQGHKPEIGLRPGDYTVPLLDLATEISTGFDQFGRQVSYRDALFDALIGYIPWGATGRQLIDPSKASSVYRNRGRKAIASRKYLRFTPQDVSLVRLHAFQKGDKLTTQQKVNRSIADLAKQRDKIGGSRPIPNSVRQAIQIQQSYYDRQDIEKKKIKQKGVWYPTKEGQTEPTLTGRQDYAIALALLRKVRGDAIADQFRTPDEIPTDQGAEELANAILYGSKKYDIDRLDGALLGALNEYRDELAQAKRDQEGS